MVVKTGWPIALTIAGSDSGGGAGIQADLKTFFALKVHGTSALTCITAQNPEKVVQVKALTADFVECQIETIFSKLPPKAAKTGMLFNDSIISRIGQFFRDREIPLVVDPVMVATSGSILLKPSAVTAMKDLCRTATLITPNLDEAQILLGKKIRNRKELEEAAPALRKLYGTAVLLKGGHLRTTNEAIDIFCDDGCILPLSAKRISGVSTHGTGCTFSAAITAFLAQGLDLLDAVTEGKKVVTSAIRNSVRVAKFDVLNP